MSEREDAIRIANFILDRVNADPDGDLAVLARQFLRAISPVRQPIASAPKDGTEFIAFENGELYRCAWAERDDGEGRVDCGWWDFWNESFEYPTHWMPLPEPPSIEAA